jgi:hypothetical protein
MKYSTFEAFESCCKSLKNVRGNVLCYKRCCNLVIENRKILQFSILITYNKDDVGLHYGGQPMGDGDGCPAFSGSIKSILQYDV